jgi:hypothetical protein
MVDRLHPAADHTSSTKQALNYEQGKARQMALGRQIL